MMDKKQMIKYFYEQIVSENRIGEINPYVSPDCVARKGEKIMPIGLEGMKQHVINVRKTYPDLRIKVIRPHRDNDYAIS